MGDQAKHLRAIGARILGEANDLKRTPSQLAAELSVPEELIDRVIAGQASPQDAKRVLLGMAEAYPVSLASIWVDEDDTDDGCRYFSADDSIKSSRVMRRRAGSETMEPYFEYRDTAMSRTAPFKPEWVKQLRVVDSSRPDHPYVAFDNGHLLHQLTFFGGPVNFYWQIGKHKYSMEMNRGDSAYVCPFVPHSFTSREPDKLGHIIAVTYAGPVRYALDEFARIGPEGADHLAGVGTRAADSFVSRLRRYMAMESLSDEELHTRLGEAGLPIRPRTECLSGQRLPNESELATFASVLRVSPIQLRVAPDPNRELVYTRRFDWQKGRPVLRDSNSIAYRVHELVRTPLQPQLKSFLFDVHAPDLREDIIHGLHEYVYNIGTEAISVGWGGAHRLVIKPGDSVYFRPTVRHGFASNETSCGQLLVVRVPGMLSDLALDEYAMFPAGIRRRVGGENQVWF